MTFAPFTDETLCALEERFGFIHRHTPPPRPASSWSKATGPRDPDFSLVFRPCNPGEWDNIMGQANSGKDGAHARAVKNLVMSTIVAVSVDGTQTIVDIEQSRSDLRTTQKPVRDVMEKLLARPGFTGIPQAVADDLAELNNVVKNDVEKG